MKSPQVRYVTDEAQAPLRFSVCTLVASEAKYRRLLASFARLGFDETNTEFLAIDNREENSFDGYRALRAVFPQCRGEYILYTHDDIELVDQGAGDLLAILRNLEARDPNWTLAGNAGWTTDKPERLVLHLVDPHGDRRDAAGPVRVGGLDENFLILRRSHMVFPSLDLSGFHLFATDLCEQSRFAGGSAWVIPFYLRHHSGGSPSPAVEESCEAFTRKYGALAPRTLVRSPAITLYVGTKGRWLKLWHGTCAQLRTAAGKLRKGAAFFLEHAAGEFGGRNETSSLRG